MMSDNEIKTYLSAALDQEACKDTLRAALISRVKSLRTRGIAPQTLLCNLKSMCKDLYQINDDVIVEVMKWVDYVKD